MADFEKKVTLIEVEVDQKAAIKEVDKLTGSIIDQKNAVQENNNEIKDLNKANKDLASEVKKGTKTQEEASKETQANKQRIDDLKKSNLSLGDGIKDLNKERARAVKTTKLQSNSLNALRAQSVKLKDQLNQQETATESGRKAFDKLQAELKETNDAIKEADKGAGDFKTNIGDYPDALGEATKGTDLFTGGLASAAKGMLGLIKQSLVFLATPIGLVIGGVALAILAVKSAFEDSEEGQNKFNKLTAIIGVTIGNLKDLLSDLGEFIIESFENPQQSITDFANLIKDNIVNRFEGLIELIPQLGKAVTQLFEGDFLGAGETAVNAVAKATVGVEDLTGKLESATEATKEFFDVTVAESKKAADVADKRAKADLLERELLVERARLESEIAELRLKSKKEDEFAAAERREALIEAQGLQDVLLKQEQEVLRLRKEAVETENTFSRSTKENLDAEAQAKADLLQIEARRLDQQRTTQRELNRLNREIEADNIRSNKEQEKAQVELDKRLEDLANVKRENENARALEKAESEQERFQIEIEQEQERFQVKQEELANQRALALEDETLSEEERQLLIEEFDAQEEELKISSDAKIAALEKKSGENELKELKKLEKQKQTIRKKAGELASKAQDLVFRSSENRVQNNADKELSVLQKQLDSGQITEEEFAQKKEELDKKTARKLHRIQVAEFRVNQITSLAEAGVSIAQSIVAAVAASPLTGGLPFSAINAGLGAVQVASILSQKPPPAPTFDRGGDVSSFMVGGKSHSLGGTKYVGEDGNRFEVEKGEAIFVANKQAAAPSLSVLSDINQKFGNGRSFFSAPRSHLQEGGSASSVSMSSDEISTIVESTAANLPVPVVKIQSIMAGINEDLDAQGLGVA